MTLLSRKKQRLFWVYQMTSVTRLVFLVVGVIFLLLLLNSIRTENNQDILRAFLFLGPVALAGFTYTWSEGLNKKGEIFVIFEQVQSNLRDFEEVRPWLERGLKAVEKYLRKRLVKVSHKDLLYSLGLSSVKNEDISGKIENLKISIVNTRARPNLYNSLMNILGDPNKIRQFERFPIGHWIEQVDPNRILSFTILMLWLALYLISMILGIPLPRLS
ncbi:hypothetical protein MUP05_03640 [Candidatus Bathyarchaeota archaeon]|nr:hypothetical protein [Candidatus Bathyarchaeota archaeon]